MKKLFPAGAELAILAAMAVVCAAAMSTLPIENGVLVILLFPMLLIAMLLGAWRTGKLAAQPRPVRQRVTLPVESDLRQIEE